VSTVPSVYRFVGLTAWQAGVRHLAVFGVFTSLAFAFVYHAYPLMVGRDWYSRGLSAFHFWTTEIGVVAGTALLLATGAAQGSIAAAGAAPGAIDVVPLLRLLTALAFAAVTVAQYAFAYNLFRTARAGPIVSVWAPATVAAGGSR
jgi:cbb3-type cytochrome oxidase subunit 1